MRQVLLVTVMAMVVGTSAAGAETFGGWQYTPPKGYKVDAQSDHLTFTKVTTPTFCSLTLFQARAMDDAPVKEQAFEWQNVVEKNFTPSGVKRAPARKTKRALAVQPTSAAVKDHEGNEFAATHYAVTPPAMIASVLLTSSTAASLKKCEPVAKAFLDSLALDPASAVGVDPEARVETPVGRWATSATDPTYGSLIKEYTFAADGTYRFRSEAWGGKLKAEQGRVVDETGTYTATGNQLALVPQKATSTIHEAGTPKPSTKVALEKVTYTWAKQYAGGSNEWNLVLTPPKKTARDGEFAANDRFSTSYLYSDAHKPEWRIAP